MEGSKIHLANVMNTEGVKIFGPLIKPTTDAMHPDIHICREPTIKG